VHVKIHSVGPSVSVGPPTAAPSKDRLSNFIDTMSLLIKKTIGNISYYKVIKLQRIWNREAASANTLTSLSFKMVLRVIERKG
jgi:hypothetical protein